MPPFSGRQTTSGDLEARIQTILPSKGLSLYQVSQQSAIRFGRPSPFFLPHNFYHALRQERFTPSIFQTFALSQVSGYRLSDWLRVFGIELEDILRLQALLPRKRTMLIDGSLVDSQAWVQWFRSRIHHSGDFPVAPLAQLLEPVGYRRIGLLPGGTISKFVYAKIGTEDVLAFPDLLPGSIVRINRELTSDSFPAKDGAVSDRLFLLEHSKGLFCCRIRQLQKNVIVPVGTKLSYAQVELRLPAHARVLGVVDFEIRSLLESAEPEVPDHLGRIWKPQPLREAKTFGELLSQARLSASLSFREAAAISEHISETLADSRYRISPSSLCDYEVQGVPPRGLHKVITLGCLYGVAFRSLLLSVGIPIERAGAEAMPDRQVRRSSPAMSEVRKDETSGTSHFGFLEQLLEGCQEIPFFLRNAIGPFAGMREIAIGDCFWLGGERQLLYPYLAKALFAIINHRRKTPFHFPAKPPWKQPVYLLLKRDGDYLCACCDVENSTLVIHPYTDHFTGTLQLRHHKDIEVIGQIVAVARRME